MPHAKRYGLTSEQLRALDVQRARLTYVIGGGVVLGGPSDGALMVAQFLNEQISAGMLAGPPVALNGDNDDAFKAAVKRYQEAHRLHNRDGIVGRETYAQMVHGKFGGKFDIEAAMQAKEIFAGREGNEALQAKLKNATETQEKIALFGSADDNHIVPVGRRGWEIAAIQYEMQKANDSLGFKPPVKVDGVWKDSDVVALKQLSVHHAEIAEKEGKADVAAKLRSVTGLGPKAYEGAFTWDESKPAGEQGLDWGRFMERGPVRVNNPQLAAQLDQWSALERARRQHEDPNYGKAAGAGVEPVATAQYGKVRDEQAVVQGR